MNNSNSCLPYSALMSYPRLEMQFSWELILLCKQLDDLLIEVLALISLGANGLVFNKPSIDELIAEENAPSILTLSIVKV